MKALTPERRRRLIPQLQRMRARRRPAFGAFAIIQPLLSSFPTGPFAGRADAPVLPYGKAPDIDQAIHGIDDEDWEGPGWYWLWIVGKYRGRRREILQLCYVESDGEISELSDIDEVGDYC